MMSSDLLVGGAHSEVGNTPEDEAEPTIEKGRHDGKNWTKIVEEWDDHGNDESKHPSHEKNSAPRSPTNNGVAVQMLGVAEKAEEDETSRN
ncbi:hypothetical protein HG531_013809 [Fusarium graminearum]|nr:hypothetical protein HG531_013809 [Fusarium graminearum]